MRKKLNKISYLINYFIITTVIISCQSQKNAQTTEMIEASNKLTENKVDNLDKVIKELNEQILFLKKENEESKSQLASLHSKIDSQSEEIATDKKNISILNRGLRSGLFQELPEDKNIKKEKKEKKSNLTMLPDLVNGRSEFTQTNSLTEETNDDLFSNTDITGPKTLLANAEIKIRRSEFKDGLNKIEELKKKFPNYDDNGRSFLLAAEAWLKLKEYNNVIPEIRNFYLKYPISAELSYAKLLEAQANEGNGSFEKAAALYNEVISLSPDTPQAKTARNGMLRMRDQK
jgi:TolA-binding protein